MAIVDIMAPVRTVLIIVSGAVSAAVAALWPRVAYRLAVPAGSPKRETCAHCAWPFPAGWRGRLALGGQCPTCHAQLGAPWWTASGIAGAAGAALAWRLPAANPYQDVLLLVWLVFVQAGTLLSLVDIAVRRLPTFLVTTLAVAVSALIAAGALLAHRPTWMLRALAAAAVLGGGYLLLALLAPSQIGMGDVRLAAVTGAMLGANGWTMVMLGAVLPYLVALPFAIARMRHTAPTSRRQVPFGPFLIVGAVIAATIAS